MKNLRILTILSIGITLWSCGNENGMEKDTSGSVTLMFDNVAGEADLSLSEEGAPYTNALGQSFNVNLMGYYISEISLSGEMTSFDDEILANAESSNGYYHLQESVAESGAIDLTGVPSGTYTEVTFKLGIDGSTIQEGALGGVLNPEDGAWFWNWNVGYIAFRLEGSSESAGSENKQLTFHIGGWGEPNNVKLITLALPTPLVVGDESSSMVHIKVDALKAFTGHMNVDFTTIYAVHSPAAGEHIAYNLENAFMVHHVMNN